MLVLYIFFPGIHGCPYAVFGYDINEIDFHPSVVFMVSCSAGRTDNVTLNQSVTARIFHSGLATFISATRDAWPNDIGRDGLGNCLGRLFFEQLVRNESVGLKQKIYTIIFLKIMNKKTYQTKLHCMNLSFMVTRHSTPMNHAMKEK